MANDPFSDLRFFFVVKNPYDLGSPIRFRILRILFRIMLIIFQLASEIPINSVFYVQT